MEEWSLVVSDMGDNGTSITVNADDGEYVFREEHYDGTPIANLSTKDAAAAILSKMYPGPMYESIVDWLVVNNYAIRDEFGSAVYNKNRE